MHAQQTRLLAFASKVVQACVAEGTSGSQTREPWLWVEELVEGSLRECEFQLSDSSRREWSQETSGEGSVVSGTIKERAMQRIIYHRN